MGNVITQDITDRWAIYNGDAMEVLDSLPSDSVHFSTYSPPFAGLYHYSSSERDLSNVRSYDEFFQMFEYFVRGLHRVTMPGRITAVHTMDVPTSNSGHNDALIDFPGDVIRLHERLGWKYIGRRAIWKEPLAVRNRTMTKHLAHKTIVDDSTQSGVASADYLLGFRRSGNNPVPVAHPTGLAEYYGWRTPPADVLKFRGWAEKQTENRFSHWVWRQYASAFWDDIRGNLGDPEKDKGGVLPFQASRDDDDEKHVHPLQLDVIRRAVTLYSNPGETVLTPFMGVGSEVYAAVELGRLGIGAELKTSYYKQTQRNLAMLDAAGTGAEQGSLFDVAGTQ